MTNYSRRKNDVLKVVVTDGTTDIARSFLYRMLIDNVFGANQSIFASLYELPERTPFLDSVMIELTSFSPSCLNGKHLFVAAPLYAFCLFEKCNYYSTNETLGTGAKFNKLIDRSCRLN